MKTLAYLTALFQILLWVPPDVAAASVPPDGSPTPLSRLASPVTGDSLTHRPDVVHVPDSGVVEPQRFLDSPTGALLRSVAFPGWGQWSNGKKQKAAVYAGIEGYFGVKALIWRHRAREPVSFATFSHARERRNYFYWITGLTIFVSMFDAYSDRYLLTLERTRGRGDEYWGGQPRTELPEAGNGWRLVLAWRF